MSAGSQAASVAREVRAGVRPGVTATSAPMGMDRSWGITILRVVIGVVFVMHGGQKLFVNGLDGVAGFMEQIGIPLPYLSGAMATFTELLGGLALVAGAFTRLAAIPLGFTMVVATVTVHLKGGFFLPAGFEYTLVLFAALVSLGFLGSGRLSVDGWIAARRPVV